MTPIYLIDSNRPLDGCYYIDEPASAAAWNRDATIIAAQHGISERAVHLMLAKTFPWNYQEPAQ